MKKRAGLKRFSIINHYFFLPITLLLLISSCSPTAQIGTKDGDPSHPLDQIATMVPSFTPTSAPSQTPDPSAAFPCIPQQVGEHGRVIEVVDGDTIKIRINNNLYPVRYIGVDTPEISFSPEPLGREAKQVNQSFVEGKTVFLYKDLNNTDQFGRLLRYVIVDGKMINNELVAIGVAEAKEYPPDTSCSELFRQSQKDAMVHARGLWANTNVKPNLGQGFKMYEETIELNNIRILSVDKKAEVVTIINDGPASIDLTGWVLLSEKGGQRCSLGGILSPGEPLQIWTTSGVGFSCGQPSPIWSNSSADPAILLDASGKEVARFSS